MVKRIFKELQKIGQPVYLTVAPPDSKSAYLVITPVSEVLSDLILGYSHQECVIQIDVYAKSFKESEKLKNKVIKSLDVLLPSQVSCSFDYEQESQLYRKIIEVSLIQGEEK